MGKKGRCVVLAVMGVLTAGSALADTVLTFDQFQQSEFERVLNFYNGGFGGVGTGPGPMLGITFSDNAQANHRDTPISGDPSPPTDLLLRNAGIGAGQPQTMTMDVAGGFSQQLIYYYVAIGRAGSIQIWDGLDATGTMLAVKSLPITPVMFTGPLSVPFLGTAKSVVFSGGNLQLVLDNLTFTNITIIPEPSSGLLLAVGLGGLYRTRTLWRRLATPR